MPVVFDVPHQGIATRAKNASETIVFVMMVEVIEFFGNQQRRETDTAKPILHVLSTRNIFDFAIMTHVLLSRRHGF